MLHGRSPWSTASPKYLSAGTGIDGKTDADAALSLSLFLSRWVVRSPHSVCVSVRMLVCVCVCVRPVAQLCGIYYYNREREIQIYLKDTRAEQRCILSMQRERTRERERGRGEEHKERAQREEFCTIATLALCVVGVALFSTQRIRIRFRTRIRNQNRTQRCRFQSRIMP